jgi:hypothetical protein
LNNVTASLVFALVPNPFSFIAPSDTIPPASPMSEATLNHFTAERGGGEEQGRDEGGAGSVTVDVKCDV